MFASPNPLNFLLLVLTHPPLLSFAEWLVTHVMSMMIVTFSTKGGVNMSLTDSMEKTMNSIAHQERNRGRRG